MFYDNSALYSTLRVVLIVLGTLGMMCSTTEFKYSRRKLAFILSLYILYIFASTFAIIYFGGYASLIRFFLITISLPAIVLIYKLAKVQASKAVFNHATQLLISLYCVFTITMINASLWNSFLADFILLLSMYILIIFLEYRFLRRPFLRLTAIVERGWGTLSLIPCALIILAVMMRVSLFHPDSSNFTSILFIYSLGVVAVIIYFSVFQNLSMQYRFQHTIRNAELLELQVNNLSETLANSEKTMERIRIERHDARHRYQIIASLIENNDTQAALDYIHTSLLQLQEPTQVRYCNNLVLNTVLASYLEQAKKENIQLETHFSFPEIFPVDVMELSIVFANALENAISACVKLPEEERRIVCKCIHNPVFTMEVSNTYEGTVSFSQENLPVTDKKGHGFGTRSIAAFCKKYDAFYVFETKNGWFSIKILISN